MNEKKVGDTFSASSASRIKYLEGEVVALREAIRMITSRLPDQLRTLIEVSTNQMATIKALEERIKALEAHARQYPR